MKKVSKPAVTENTLICCVLFTENVNFFVRIWYYLLASSQNTLTASAARTFSVVCRMYASVLLSMLSFFINYVNQISFTEKGIIHDGNF